MSDWDDEERAALVALLRLRPGKRTWTDIVEKIGQVGSARAVWDEIYPPTLFGDTDAHAGLDAARRSVAHWRRQNFSFTTFVDDDYPERLRDVRQMPPFVFYAGSIKRGEKVVSIVGSRSADPDALRFARELAHLLVIRNITVVSGLAAGVDTAAHRAALDAGGRTVAVIGTGITRQYPAENRDLHFEIARHGLVLSQFWPDAGPTRVSFPQRNVIMSAYGHATMVVAATENSGTRIQAREAVAHGRAVILADRVVESTDWGRKLADAPGVYVAGTPQEALDAADAVFGVDDAIVRLLSLSGN